MSDERVSALVPVSWMYGCAPRGNGVICRIGTSTINSRGARASIINRSSAASARLRKWRCRDARRFPTNEGDRRRGRCRATERDRPGPARRSFPGLLPGALSQGSFPGLSGGDFSRGSLPGLSEDTAAAAGTARRQRNTSAMAGGGTADCGLQVSGGSRGRAGAGASRRWGNGACKQVSAIGNTLIRWYRQHMHKNPRCFGNRSGKQAARGEDTGSCGPCLGWEQPRYSVPDNRAGGAAGGPEYRDTGAFLYGFTACN